MLGVVFSLTPFVVIGSCLILGFAAIGCLVIHFLKKPETNKWEKYLGSDNTPYWKQIKKQ